MSRFNLNPVQKLILFAGASIIAYQVFSAQDWDIEYVRRLKLNIVAIFLLTGVLLIVAQNWQFSINKMIVKKLIWVFIVSIIVLLLGWVISSIQTGKAMQKQEAERQLKDAYNYKQEREYEQRQLALSSMKDYIYLVGCYTRDSSYVYCRFDNLWPKKIMAFSATVRFEDILSKEGYKIDLDCYKEVESGRDVAVYWDHDKALLEQFIIAFNADHLKISNWQLNKIVFVNGVKASLDELPESLSQEIQDQEKLDKKLGNTSPILKGLNLILSSKKKTATRQKTLP